MYKERVSVIGAMQYNGLDGRNAFASRAHCAQLASFKGNAKGRIKIGQTKIMRVNTLLGGGGKPAAVGQKKKKGTKNFEKYTHTHTQVRYCSIYHVSPEAWVVMAVGTHSIYQPEEPLSNENKICFGSKELGFFLRCDLLNNGKR